MTTDDRTQQVNKHQNMSGGTTSKRAQFNKTQNYAHCYSRFIKKSSVASSLPSVKPWLKRRRIKAKRNEIALWILKIDGNLKMLFVARRNIAA
jgi:hypothetical protein